jgi:hypothetical protein
VLHRIDAARHRLAGGQQAQGVLGREADVGVDEQQVGGLWVGQEAGGQPGPGAGDQPVVLQQLHMAADPLGLAGRLQGHHRVQVFDGDLAAMAGGGDEEVRLGHGLGLHASCPARNGSTRWS